MFADVWLRLVCFVFLAGAVLDSRLVWEGLGGSACLRLVLRAVVALLRDEEDEDREPPDAPRSGA